MNRRANSIRDARRRRRPRASIPPTTAIVNGSADRYADDAHTRPLCRCAAVRKIGSKKWLFSAVIIGNNKLFRPIRTHCYLFQRRWSHLCGHWVEHTTPARVISRGGAVLEGGGAVCKPIGDGLTSGRLRGVVADVHLISAVRRGPCRADSILSFVRGNGASDYD
jgi:hypothetical protein